MSLSPDPRPDHTECRREDRNRRAQSHKRRGPLAAAAHGSWLMAAIELAQSRGPRVERVDQEMTDDENDRRFGGGFGWRFGRGN